MCNMTDTTATSRDRSWIAARIPHQGSMCLLDAVRAWDATRAQCVARSHRAADNPLRNRGRLGAVCAIEYAAQAMAVHAALLAESAGANAQRPGAGFLASARAVHLAVARLDDIAADLEIEVERMSDASDSVLYRFAISAGGRAIATGRAAVMLDAGAQP
jgi:predicted hotdog family 3-hydroxylacyl-ACP dehydratase